MVDFSPEIRAFANPIRDIVVSATGSVERTIVGTVENLSVNTLDIQRNLKEAYQDTQANLFMTGNNVVAGIENLGESTQRNIFSTIRDSESRFFSAIDSFLDRLIDLGVTIVSDVITILLIALISVFGVGILYSAELLEFLKHVTTRLL